MKFQGIFEEAEKINFLRGPGVKNFVAEFLKPGFKSEGKQCFVIKPELVAYGDSEKIDTLSICLDNLNNFLKNIDPEKSKDFWDETKQIFGRKGLDLSDCSEIKIHIISLLAIKHLVKNEGVICISGLFDDCEKDLGFYNEAISILLSMCKERDIFLASESSDFEKYCRQKIYLLNSHKIETFYLTESNKVLYEENFCDRILCKDLLDFVYKLKKGICRDRFYAMCAYKDELGDSPEECHEEFISGIEKKIDDFLLENEID